MNNRLNIIEHLINLFFISFLFAQPIIYANLYPDDVYMIVFIGILIIFAVLIDWYFLQIAKTVKGSIIVFLILVGIAIFLIMAFDISTFDEHMKMPRPFRKLLEYCLGMAPAFILNIPRLLVYGRFKIPLTNEKRIKFASIIEE